MVYAADVREAAAPASPWRATTLVLVFNGLSALWLLLRPGSHGLVVAVDNVAQFVGPLLVLPLCFDLPGAHRLVAGLRRVVALLWAALACIVVTDSIFDYLTLHNAYHTGTLRIRRRAAPSGSRGAPRDAGSWSACGIEARVCRTPGGTGLGLYLGRQLAQAMGGDLELEDTGPAGTTFRLRLLARPRAPAPGAQS
jgi:hypothetical protein